jgi:hypothetical protein
LSNSRVGYAEADAGLEREEPLLVAAELEEAVLEGVLGDLVVEAPPRDAALEGVRPVPLHEVGDVVADAEAVLLEVLRGVLAADVEDADVVLPRRRVVERRRAPPQLLPGRGWPR